MKSLLKVRARCKTANIKEVMEQPRTNRAEHAACITQLNGNLNKMKGKLELFLQRRNGVTDSR